MQERLAEETGMHRTYLAGIERALGNPGFESVVKLAKALGVTLSVLFAEKRRRRFEKRVQ